MPPSSKKLNPLKAILTVLARSQATNFVDASPSKVRYLSWWHVKCSFDV